MRQQNRRHISVVLDQIALGDFQFWPEQFFKIRELHLAATKPEFELLDILRNFNTSLYTARAWRGGVFRRMIIAMCFCPNHVSHRFTQIGTDKKPELKAFSNLR